MVSASFSKNQDIDWLRIRTLSLHHKLLSRLSEVKSRVKFGCCASCTEPREVLHGAVLERVCSLNDVFAVELGPIK